MTKALESRIEHIAELPGNPLGIEFRQFGNVRATLVRGDLLYYHYFNAIRGAGAGKEEAIDEALSWFQDAGRTCGVAVSPFDADEGLLRHLAQRGLRQSRFMSVLYGSAAALDDGAVEVGESLSDFLTLWLDGEPVEEHASLRRIGAAEFKDWRCYVALVDGQPAAMAGLYIHDGAGALASAWTNPTYREQGCQTALLRRRISDAAAAGCDLIVTTATPGSGSQRNMERVGLRTAYTQAIWTTEPAGE